MPKLAVISPPGPKLKLCKDLLLPEDFRRKFNAWLANRFGYQEWSLKPGQVLFAADVAAASYPPEGTFFCRPEDAVVIQRLLDNAQLTNNPALFRTPR